MRSSCARFDRPDAQDSLVTRSPRRTESRTTTIVTTAANAQSVLLACLLNLGGVVTELRGREDLQVICSGTDGSGTDGAVALEDVYVAGRVTARPDGPRTDAARVAEGVARGFPTAFEALAASADAAGFRAAGIAADIGDCASESAIEVVPVAESVSADVAFVIPAC